MLQNTLVRGVFACFGVFLCLLLFSACDSQQPTVDTHQTYSFHGPASYTTQPQSGQLIQLDWKPQPGPQSSAAAPDSILLTASLVGPFSTQDALQAAITQSKANHDTFAKPLVVSAAEPILTDSWNHFPHSSLLTVPGKLQPGYYDLFYASTLTANGKIITNRTDSPIHF